MIDPFKPGIVVCWRAEVATGFTLIAIGPIQEEVSKVSGVT